MKETVTQIFNDLEEYLNFCREYGRVFNEAHLYKERTPYDDFVKWKGTGKARQWPGWPFNRKKYDNNRERKRPNYRNSLRVSKRISCMGTLQSSR